MLVKLIRRRGKKFRGSNIAVHKVFHNVAPMRPGKRISIESANRTTTTNHVSQKTPRAMVRDYGKLTQRNIGSQELQAE